MITITQRHLRAPRPGRPTTRVAATGEHLAALAQHLTQRDRWLARMLGEHRVLTTTQITQLAFPSRHVAHARLLKLHRWRVVDRFQPLVARGSAPHHYVLDTAGAAIIADEDGISPHELGNRHDRAMAIAHSLQLAHTVATNGIFAALVAAARRSDGTCALRAWWPERRCRHYWGDIVRPDAYGRWRGPHGEVEFFLELDLATESLTKVTGKLDRYAHLAATTGIATPILFAFPTAAREENARDALTAVHRLIDNRIQVPVATATVNDNRSDSSPPLWRPLSHREPGTDLSALAAIWPLRHRPSPTPEHVPLEHRARPPADPMPPAPLARV